MKSPGLAPLIELPLQWDLFHTQADQHLAQIYVRLRAGIELQDYWNAGWKIEGQLYGPHCSRSHTLPARYTLTDQGAGTTLLARAMLPDPCFWSAEIPALYEVTLQLSHNGQIQQQYQTLYGLPSLLIKNQQFQLNTEPWILRAAHVNKLARWSADACREQSLALVVDRLDESLLQEASQLGIWIIAILTGSEAKICDQLSKLVASPAVCMGVIQGTVKDPEQLQNSAPNMLLGQWVRQASDLPPAQWCQFVFCDFRTAADFSQSIKGCSLPIVAVRSVDETCSLEEALEACQLLESDAITAEPIAGYAII